IMGVIEVVKFLIGVFEDLWDGISEGVAFAGELIGTLADAFWEVVDGIKGAAVWLFNAISDAVSGVVHAITSVFDWVVEKAKEAGETIRKAPVIKQVTDIGESLSSGPSMFDQITQAVQSQVAANGTTAMSTTTNTPTVNAQVTINAGNADAQAVA